MEVWSNSPEETQKVGESLAKSLKPGDVIALFGQLGAGKTVLIKGIAHGLNIKKKIVSPTFVFMRAYKVKFKKKSLTFYHLDLYRSQTKADYQNLGLDEVFSAASIVAIEWADKIKSNLPKKRIDIFIKSIDDQKRLIKINRC